MQKNDLQQAKNAQNLSNNLSFPLVASVQKIAKTPWKVILLVALPIVSISLVALAISVHTAATSKTENSPSKLASTTTAPTAVPTEEPTPTEVPSMETVQKRARFVQKKVGRSISGFLVWERLVFPLSRLNLPVQSVNFLVLLLRK